LFGEGAIFKRGVSPLLNAPYSPGHGAENWRAKPGMIRGRPSYPYGKDKGGKRYHTRGGGRDKATTTRR